MKPKPCKDCPDARHTSLMCPKKRKPMKQTTRLVAKKPMSKVGKVGKAWQKTRATWFRQHPQDSYTCYICGKYLAPSETTLDHVKSRGRNPELRNEQSNLKPCCWACNTAKGSKDLHEIKEIRP